MLLRLAVLLLAAVAVQGALETQTALKARLLADYDQYTRPSLAVVQNEHKLNGGPNGSFPTAPPDMVTTQFYIDFLTVNQKSKDYTLEGYLRAYWKDERLKYNGTSEGGCTDTLFFADASQLWVPDFYFEMAAKVDLTQASSGQYAKVSPDGSVVWSRQSRITLRCKMHFGNIPFDTQRCSYVMGLYSQLADEVVLKWLPDATALDNWDGVSTAVWEVELKDEDVINDVTTYSTGTYTYATAFLTFKRIEKGYVISYLILALFGVTMSYTGFYINPAATPGRVALAVITVLNVSGLQAAARNQLPPFSYNTWLTDFMFYSYIFNVVGFFEMALVNFGMSTNAKYEKQEEAAKVAAKAKTQSSTGADGGDPDADAELNPDVKAIEVDIVDQASPRMRFISVVRKMKDLDITMRWLFPLCYCIFCIIMATQVGKYHKDVPS